MMKKPNIYAGYALTVLLITNICSGCRSAAPPMSFYTLSAIHETASQPQSTSMMQDLTIGVGPVQFPDYLDRPQIVTRSGANRLDMSEFNRWAGHLDRDFLNVFAENLSILLSAHRVIIHPWKLQENPDYRIEVDVHQFEAQTGGPVLLNATWSVCGRDPGEKTLHLARSVISKPLPGPASGQDYDALVSAYSQAVADLSREVSAAMSGVIKQAKASDN